MVWRAVIRLLLGVRQTFIISLRTSGWLVNIENRIAQEHVPFLRDFVAELTKQCHEAKPETTVLWYDSVTKHGFLEWQNALTAENKLFFDACDGIFLNYTWKPGHLTKSAVLAGARWVWDRAGREVEARMATYSFLPWQATRRVCWY